MGRPSKASGVIEAERKSHRTKAEIEQRKNAEAAQLSGKPLTEWNAVKNDDEAHKFFLKIRALLSAVKKDDALYSAQINRYCLLYSEISEMQKEYKMISEMLSKLSDKVENCEGVGEIAEISKTLSVLAGKLLNFDGAIMRKRKMMGEIERENGMTVAAALRAIPKETDPTGGNPLLAALMNDDD